MIENPSITAFRRVGTVVDGVAHAHIALQFNLQSEEQVVVDLMTDLASISRNTSAAMWAPIVHEVAPMRRDWEDFRQELKGTSIFPARERRQALVAVALGTVVAASAGAGLFAIKETRELKARMDRNDLKVAHMLAAMNSSLRLEKRLQQDVSTLKIATSEIKNAVGALDNAVIVSEAVHSLVYRMRQRLEGLKGVWNHRLDTALLNSEELNHVFDLMTRRVAKNGYELVLDGAHQLHRVELSYVLEGDVLTLFLHVPVTPSRLDNTLDLYQHLALPIGYNQTYGLVRGPATLLAVDHKRETFVEMNADELQGCNKVASDFSCAKVFPRTRGGRTSCLPALFLHHESSAQWCTVDPIKQQTAFYQLNQTTVLVLARQRITLNIECGDDEMTAVDIYGLALVAVRSHCTVVTDDFVFRAATGSLPSDLMMVISAPSLNLVERLREAEEEFGRKFRNISFSAASEDVDVDNIEEELTAAAVGNPRSWDWYAINWIIAVLVCGVLIFICWSSSLRLTHRSAASVQELIQARINAKVANDYVNDQWESSPLVPPTTPEPRRHLVQFPNTVTVAMR